MKDIVDILINEHNNISKFIDEVEKSCILFMEEDKIDFDKFYGYVKFIREYADGTHHKKEEDILFKEMLLRLGKIAENLVKNGMLVEHDLARLYVMELEKALDTYKDDKTSLNKLSIISNAMSYVNLLRRHIAKENEVVFPYAQRSFDNELIEELSKQALEFDREHGILHD